MSSPARSNASRRKRGHAQIHPGIDDLYYLAIPERGAASTSDFSPLKPKRWPFPRPMQRPSLVSRRKSADATSRRSRDTRVHLSVIFYRPRPYARPGYKQACLRSRSRRGTIPADPGLLLILGAMHRAAAERNTLRGRTPKRPKEGTRGARYARTRRAR